MLRFCDEGTPSSLASHLFSVNVSPLSHDVHAEQIYPETKDEKLMKNVMLFAFPNPSSIESKTFFSFVIGDTCCEFDIGFVYYRNSFNAYCLITRYYYPNLFRKVLSMKNEDSIIEEVKKLEEKRIRKTVVVENEEFYLDGSREKQELMKLIFDCFSGFDITKIVIAILQARHIFVVASSAEKCSTMCAALPLLIEPFRWDLNIIPVLPLQLKDASQIPVPTMIGITNAEVLLEGRVDSNIIVNCDAKFTIDNPILDENSPNQQKIVQLQMRCHSIIQNDMNIWSSSPGFPYLYFSKVLMKFIASYLLIYTGNVKTINEFFNEIKKLPEYLESSQVLHDLLNLEEAPKLISCRINKWIDETFKHKKSEIIAYKESNSQEITIPKPVEQTKRDNNSNIELLDELFGNNNNQTPKPKENDLLNLFEDFPKYNKIPPNRSRSQQFLPKDDLFTTPAKSTNNDDLLILFDTPQSSQQPLTNDQSVDFLQLLSEDDYTTDINNISSAKQPTQIDNEILNLFPPSQNKEDDSQTNLLIF